MTIKHLLRTTAATVALATFALARAAGPTPTSGSIDIYSTNFQKMFPAGERAHRISHEALHPTYTNMWFIDYEKEYASEPGVRASPIPAGCAPYSGSLNIYFTNFQAEFGCGDHCGASRTLGASKSPQPSSLSPSC